VTIIPPQGSVTPRTAVPAALPRPAEPHGSPEEVFLLLTHEAKEEKSGVR